MTTFQISAPGRISLSGEYTAMYGKQVVVASLNIRTMLTFHQLSQESKIIRIVFPDVDILLDIPMEMIEYFMSKENYNSLVDDYILLLKHVQYFITLNGLWKSYEQRFSLQIFFFLLFYIARKEGLVINSFRVFVATQLPMKEGLGSSTSFATCLAACFLHWACLQKDDHNGFTTEELKRISEYVMYSEKDLQNYVYQEDHNVCTHGYVTTFLYTGMLNAQSEFIYGLEMNILLVDAKIQQCKRQKMKELAAMKYSNARDVDYWLIHINSISLEIVNAMRTFTDDHSRRDCGEIELLYQTLELTFHMNHMLLYDLKLSNLNFENICSIATRYGYRGKLAGVGASYVIILLPPNISKDEKDNFMKHLVEEGFIPRKTTISCNGVQLE